jgi:hypothetical protein
MLPEPSLPLKGERNAMISSRLNKLSKEKERDASGQRRQNEREAVALATAENEFEVRKEAENIEAE